MPSKGTPRTKRHVIVTYYARRSGSIIKQTQARYADRAVATTLHHLWTGRYPRARFAVIYNEETGLEIARIAPTLLGFIATHSRNR